MDLRVLSDKTLLNQYLAGDRNAISHLIERHRRRVRDYIYMLVKDRDAADDIFQETFIKAVRVIDEAATWTAASSCRGFCASHTIR